jgi:quercetin dioxygenase-like cupin family protein
MSTTKANIADVEPKFGGMHRLREALGSEAVGLTVVDCDPGWEGPEHEHGEEGHEEIYLLLEGGASVTVDGETVALSPGDAVLVPPDATRQIHNGDAESRLILAGANR